MRSASILFSAIFNQQCTVLGLLRIFADQQLTISYLQEFITAQLSPCWLQQIVVVCFYVVAA